MFKSFKVQTEDSESTYFVRLSTATQSQYILGLSRGAQPYEVGGLGVLRLHLETFKHAQQNLFFVTAILDKSTYDSEPPPPDD